jgi:CHAD domain-containing protein
MDLLKETPLCIAARSLLAERGADFFQCWNKTSSTFEAEDIHDLRVSSRRLREGLRLFEPCYPDKRISRLRKTIRKVTGILGDLRNIDVTLSFLREEAAELGVEHGRELDGCIALYEGNRKKARKLLKKDMRRLEPDSLRKFFIATINAPFLFEPPPGKADPFSPIGTFARENMDLRLGPILDLVPLARNPEESGAQHRLRIAIKRYRYRMEVLSTLMGEGYRELHGHVKEYQELLGRIHDLDVFAELLAGIGLSEETEQALMGMIAAKRGESFAGFTMKLASAPLEEIGARVRSLL